MEEITAVKRNQGSALRNGGGNLRTQIHKKEETPSWKRCGEVPCSQTAGWEMFAQVQLPRLQ